MWNVKLGIAVSCKKNDADSLFSLIKSVGFDAVAPEWSNELSDIVSSARAHGLNSLSKH